MDYQKIMTAGAALILIPVSAHAFLWWDDDRAKQERYRSKVEEQRIELQRLQFERMMAQNQELIEENRTLYQRSMRSLSAMGGPGPGTRGTRPTHGTQGTRGPGFYAETPDPDGPCTVSDVYSIPMDAMEGDSRDLEIVRRYRLGETLSQIAEAVFGSRGGRQYQLIRAVLSERGIITQ